MDSLVSKANTALPKSIAKEGKLRDAELLPNSAGRTEMEFLGGFAPQSQLSTEGTDQGIYVFRSTAASSPLAYSREGDEMEDATEDEGYITGTMTSLACPNRPGLSILLRFDKKCNQGQ